MSKPKIHNILPVYFSQTAECRFIQKMLSDNFVKVQQLSRQQKCLQYLEYFTGLSINLLCKTLACWKISRTSGLGASFKINKWLCRHQRNQVTLTDRRNTLVYRASVKVKLPLLVCQECNDNKFSKKHFQQRMKTSRSQRQYRTFALWPSDKLQGLSQRHTWAKSLFIGIKMVPLIPVRYIFTGLAFIGFVFNYTLRVGILQLINFKMIHTLDSSSDQYEPGDNFYGQPDRTQHQPEQTSWPGNV